jgi:H+-transporting ATPase
LRRGEVTGAVSATGIHTYFGKTVELVQIAKPRLHMEEVTSKVVGWLLMMIVALLALGAVASLLKGENVVDLLPLAVILLISAIPIALPTMFMISMALGSVELAKMGVLTTRLNAIENAATMDVLCVDKTGTITENRLHVADVLPIDGYAADDVILYGALASREANQDPIDIAFLSAARERGISLGGHARVEYTPFDPVTRRTSAVVEKEGQAFVVSKGALNVIVPGCINCGLALTPEMAEAEKSRTEKGYRAIAVAQGGSMKSLDLVGIAFLYDKPLRDSAPLVSELKGLGIEVKMLTGDALPIAREAAKEVGLGSDVASFMGLRGKDEKKALGIIEKSNGFAEVYPADKYFIVESLQRAGHIAGMTGDGVNDAPALRQADVGIAVSCAVDVAKKAAGIVLTTEGLSGIVDLVVNGRRIYRRVNTWVINKIVKTFQAIVFVILAFILTGQPIISIFAMILFLFLSDFVTLSISTDNVTYSHKPDRWDIMGLVKVAAPLGLLIVIESFILLFAGYRYFGLAGTDRQYTYVFDTLMFMALFDVLIVRERGHFWESMPGTFLLASIALDTLLVACISVIGFPGLAPIPYTAVLAVLAFSAIATFVVNDAVKVLLIKILWKEEI